MPKAVLDVRVVVGRPGIGVVNADGESFPLAPWSAVTRIQVLGLDDVRVWPAARALLASEEFGDAWRARPWTAILVFGDQTGEVFLGTTNLSPAHLRRQLVPVAAAMPATWEGQASAAAESDAPEHPVVTGQPSAHAPGAESPGTLADELERLASLRERGLLDEAEFARAKATLLSEADGAVP